MYREQQLKALLEGRRLLIAGYGREGQSAERLIKRLLPGAAYSVATQVEEARWKDESGKWHDEWPFDLIVKSPGIPTFQFGASERNSLSSLTSLFLQVYGDRVIRVSGTKGKSTTASLLHHLLPGSILAGNIGIPLFDIIDQIDEQTLVVAELSCHQLEGVRRGPHIGVLLNLFQEHLDHYGSYMDYKLAKLQMALTQRQGDHFFYCVDNEELRSLVDSWQLTVGSELHPYSINDTTVEERELLKVCPLEGEHNRSNALVACRVASLVLRQPLSTLRHPLSTFHGLRHRMERVGERRGITWYDDSISTIPAAAIAAVRALGRVDTLILGGFDRGIDYQPLVDFLLEHPVVNLVFVGQAGRRILDSWQRAAGSRQLAGSYLVEDDYTKIVPWCAEHTPRGGVVLLSPAAASYDAFKNFEQRGDFYAAQIDKL